jgi:hypothetical protein
MELDDLKPMWASHTAALERSLALNERLLREILLRKVRWTLVPYFGWRTLEIMLGVAALLVVVPVLAAHLTAPRYLVAGGAVLVFVVVITAHSVVLLALTAGLEYDRPVLAIQRAVQRVRLIEYRSPKWALLGGMVIWLPALLVGLEALSGFDALARVHLRWLIGNVVFGFAVLAIGQALSKRYVERADLGPVARWLVDAASGRSLKSAAVHLTDLARFERDDRDGLS